MNKIKEIGLTAVIATIAVVVVLFVLGFIGVKPPLGSVEPNNMTRNSTTTQYTLGAGAIEKARATSTCSSRTITTGAVGVGLAFMDEPLTTAFLGHWQPASTTTDYPAETFGCGGLRVRAPGATKIQVTEFY